VGNKGPSERITLPDALDPFSETGSDIRRVVPLDAVPWLVLSHEDLVALPLDSRAGFVLSLVDGRCTVEMILDVAAMDERETIDILGRLVRLGVLQLRDAYGHLLP
jgi:hypothetical protein